MKYILNMLLNIRAQSFEMSAYTVGIAAKSSLTNQTNSLSRCSFNKPSLLTQ